MKTYTHYTDPGHGWVAVSKADMIKYGVVDTISKYSFMDTKKAYLEEDSDAMKFFDAYKRVHGEYPKTKESYSENSMFRKGKKADYNPKLFMAEVTIGDKLIQYWDGKPKVFTILGIDNQYMRLLSDRTYKVKMLDMWNYFQDYEKINAW